MLLTLMPLNKQKNLQRNLNRFTNKYLKGVNPLIVDGDIGPATNKRVKRVKFFLGYKVPVNSEASKSFLERLAHPRQHDSYPDKKTFKLSKKRCRKQRRDWLRNRLYSYVAPGVRRFEGKPVAKWFIPYLEYARKNGWKGGVNSGWRDPAYSEQLCYQICGAPTCPGRCAGRSSNHSGSKKPAGAIDVSDPATFGRLMKQKNAPKPLIHNALGSADPWHYSISGR